jgi:hypothetical protein
MTKIIKSHERSDEAESAPYPVRLPGFIVDEEIGLGEVIKRTASYFGIPPCGGCGSRADAMDRRVVFTGRKSREK